MRWRSMATLKIVVLAPDAVDVSRLSVAEAKAMHIMGRL